MMHFDSANPVSAQASVNGPQRARPLKPPSASLPMIAAGRSAKPFPPRTASTGRLPGSGLFAPPGRSISTSTTCRIQAQHGRQPNNPSHTISREAIA